MATFSGRSSPIEKGFYFSAAAKWGLGISGSVNETIAASRDLYRYGGEVNLGMHIGSFLLGGSTEYILWQQKTKASEVSNTNMSGTQLNFAPIMGVGLGKLLLSVKPVLSSQMKLDKKDISNQTMTYTTPDFPSYVLQLNYKLSGRSYVGVEYSKITYEKVKINGEETKLDDQVIYKGWGLIYGFMF